MAAESAATHKMSHSVDELSDEFLACRDLRHLWEKPSDWSVKRNSAGRIVEFTRAVVCGRCGTERHETYVVPTMDVIRRRYVYPNKFMVHLPDNSGRVNVRDVRREVFKRLAVS